MSDEERRDEEAAGPPEEQEEKGLGLTEEFARLEEEIRREVSSDSEAEADAEPAADAEPVADAGPADLDDDAGPAAGEWTAPAADVPGPEAPSGETEEWELDVADEGEDAESAGDEEPEQPEAEEESAEEWVAPTPEPASEQVASVGPPGAEEPPADDDVEHTVVRRGPPPVPIAASGYGEPEEDPEIKTPALWWRFLMASVLIVVSVATAVSVSSLLLLTDVAAKLQPIPGLKDKLAEIGPGDPQTILIIGSDKRTNLEGDPGRSDTTMLLRVDPDKQVLSLFSLPRDLEVDIPGYGGGMKLNEAFAIGGVKKTTETVKALTGLEINHVVNVDFFGFAEAVNAIGCVYVDVDRHYFNDNSLNTLETFAEINVNAGYQKLCGQNALDYVRYRHTDTDIVRAARQQDFLRNARQQVPISEVLPIVGGDTGSDLIDIFTKYTSSDIDDPAQMIGALKAFLAVKDVPINQISFDGELGPSFVTATPEQIQKAVDEFLNGKDTPGPTGGENATKPDDSGGGSSGGSGGSKDKKKADEDPTDGANLIPTSDVLDPETGINKFDAFGKTSSRRLPFPIWVPTAVVPGSTYSADSRQYDIKDEDDKKQPAYKLVIEYSAPDRLPEYYGVQGTTWSDPPILRDSHDTQEIDGKDFDIYYDGDRIRLIAWHDKDGNSYWISNTLVQTIDNSDMLAMAASMKEIN